jgi:hypothetical protein
MKRITFILFYILSLQCFAQYNKPIRGTTVLADNYITTPVYNFVGSYAFIKPFSTTSIRISPSGGTEYGSYAQFSLSNAPIGLQLSGVKSILLTGNENGTFQTYLRTFKDDTLAKPNDSTTAISFRALKTYVNAHSGNSSINFSGTPSAYSIPRFTNSNTLIGNSSLELDGTIFKNESNSSSEAIYRLRNFGGTNFNMHLCPTGGVGTWGAIYGPSIIRLGGSTSQGWLEAQSGNITIPAGNLIISGTISGTAILKILIVEYTTNHTLISADAYKVINMTSATANVVTVPANIFSIGDQVTINMNGTGQTTIAAGASVIIHSLDGALNLTGQYAKATLIYEGNNIYQLTGQIY